MKNSNDNIGNRTRDLPSYSVASHPTALPRATLYFVGLDNILYIVNTATCFDAFASSSVSLKLLVC